MKSENELLARNVELLKSTVNRQGLYGLFIALVAITAASLLVSYQVTGNISIASFLYVHEHNLALRILDFLPFIFTYWGQNAGYRIASRAGEIILAETDDLRAETTSWKIKSLHESTHDALTGMPNRVLFYEQTRQAIISAAQSLRPVITLFMDLDRFKEVNDSFGHATGDLTLKLLSTRIQRSIASGDTLARMGGDEFALLLDNVRDGKAGVEVAMRIQKLLAAPFIVEGHKIELSVSIGISVYPEYGSDVDTLIQYAEIASHAAKHTIEGVVVYTPELKQENPRRLTLTSDLRRAIENEELELYFQPKVEIFSGRATAVEALLRWNHAEHGQISPEEFTRLAERARLIVPLTRMVIKKAITRLQEWHRTGKEISLSLNITARDLNDPGLPLFIEEMLNLNNIDPSWLTLEITESSVMENAEQALRVINRLSELKLRLSIDDFGTGYSSLAYLSKLPVHELKIDKSFVMGMKENSSDSLIVKATIELGHNLCLKVVAEGIEDKQTWDYLKKLGCDVGQGYYLSPPLPEAELMNRLSREFRTHPY